jgi:GntR family transcriptional regulator/MocR family aminotransferase
MAKSVTAQDLVIREAPAGASLYQWVYDELRSAILQSRLSRGMRLPSTRELARRYAVSRGTVVTVFEQLHAEGYLEGRVGAGTYVSARLPEDLLHAKRGSSAMARKATTTPKLSQYASRLVPAPSVPLPAARAFRIASPALDAFPLAAWAQIASRRLRNATRSLLADVDARGYWPLREAVADYLGTARGVNCTAEQVIIAAGIQQGLDLTARLVLDPGDPVWVEDPCYFVVTAVFKALGARPIPVPVDERGLSVEEGKRRCEHARLVYLTPAHQFPLGVTMTADRRLEVLEWARRERSLIFEDDYDSEYRYSGRPIPALQGLDHSGWVILAGSFSKLLFPSLRLGYLVVPNALVEKFTAARFVMDRHSSVIDQAILCDFITEGHFARHIRRMRELYAARLAVLRDSVERKLKGRLRLPEIEAGVQTAAWLAEGFNAEAVAKAALDLGVEVVPLNRFASQVRLPEGFLLGFGAVDAGELSRGVDCLASACYENRSSTGIRQPGTAGSASASSPR